ncbi:MAG: threonylcarbamoyl-AMP synthase [Clostridiales bacterium]|nr:threonylcarbamoyl-AMP synthase [Clostridiales bacterium]
MNTKIIKLESLENNEEKLIEAAKILQEGGLVAFPTETVYGLGADGLNSEAAAKIYSAKGRPSDNPLILHIADMDMISKLAKNISEDAMKVMNAFWPGPLTVILNKTDIVPYGTTGGLDTVAIRMPSHPVARELIRIAGVAVAAPSANTSGRPSPTTAQHVIQDLDGKIDMVVDGGKVGIGIESTIVDMTGENPMILRPGYITKPMLEEVVKKTVSIDPAILSKEGMDGVRPKAPGMKYKHYAPKGDLTIVSGDNIKKVVGKIHELVEEKQKEGYRVGIIATDETVSQYGEGIVKSIGSREDEVSISVGLYSVLREFDDEGVDFIYSESFEQDDFGQAIMNRLLKAAGYSIIKV